MFAAIDGNEINLRYNDVEDCYVMDRYDFDCTEIGVYDVDIAIEEDDDFIQADAIEIIYLSRRCIYFILHDEEDDDDEQPEYDMGSYGEDDYSESSSEEESS